MAVMSAARQDVGGRQGVAGMQQLQQLQQQPSTESVTKPDHVVTDPQKRKIAETEENSEVKRVRINQLESGMRMENIVNEEWKRISLGIEKQARAVNLQFPDATEKKFGNFSSELKCTIINKPSSESKQTASGAISGSRIVREPQSKNITVPDSAARAKQDQVSPKSRDKHSRWDDTKESGKGRKHDDKRSHQKNKKTPPRSYQSPSSLYRYGGEDRVLSLHDDKHKRNLSAGKGAVSKLSATGKLKDIIVIDDNKSAQSAASKAAGKSPVVKASSSNQSSLTTTTTAASSVPSFRFGWKAKIVKPTLPKPGAQSGPMPGNKVPEKGKITVYLHG